jgi:radical SAM protein with 4Fe4S-binding SPASM domain
LKLPSLGELAWRFYRKLETKDHELRYLFLEVTRRCNLACRHCGSDCSTSAPAKPELGLGAWKALLDRVRTRWEPFIVITGGEPLLYEGLDELCAHIRGLGLRYGMVSNGWLLDDGRAERLKELGIESLTVSLDGLKASHDWLRGRAGSFERAVRAIEAARKAGIALRDVVTCAYPGMAHELDAVGELIIGAGADSWRIFAIIPRGRAAAEPALRMGRADYASLLEWIAARRPAYKGRGLELSLSCDGWLPYRIDRRVRSQPFFCRSGIQIAGVLADGAIVGCTNNDPSFNQGSIMADDFVEAWEGGFKPHRERPWLGASSCATCPFERGCQGGSLHAWGAEREAPLSCWNSR